MKRFAFISRHAATLQQIELAAVKGIELFPVGDRDAFTIDPSEFKEFDGVIVVHPAAALLLTPHYTVGVFENANRAKEGERPQFEAKALHIFRLDRTVFSKEEWVMRHGY